MENDKDKKVKMLIGGAFAFLFSTSSYSAVILDDDHLGTDFVI